VKSAQLELHLAHPIETKLPTGREPGDELSGDLERRVKGKDTNRGQDVPRRMEGSG
jgi:hypothetical protein